MSHENKPFPYEHRIKMFTLVQECSQLLYLKSGNNPKVRQLMDRQTTGGIPTQWNVAWQ